MASKIAWKVIRLSDGMLLSAVTRLKGFETVYSMENRYDGIMAFINLEDALQFMSRTYHCLRDGESFMLWKVEAEEIYPVASILPSYFFASEGKAKDFLKRAHTRWLRREFKLQRSSIYEPPPGTVLCNRMYLFGPVLTVRKDGIGYSGSLFFNGKEKSSE